MASVLSLPEITVLSAIFALKLTIMIEDERPKHEKLFTNQTQTAGTGMVLASYSMMSPTTYSIGQNGREYLIKNNKI